MAKYFNYFPTTFYSNSNTSIELDTVTNIIARFAFENSLKENSSIFYPYDIQDGDTPEIIANKYYGSPEKHWIVLLFNDIIDPQYDWPLDQITFVSYVNDKYSANCAANTTVQSGIVWAQSTNNVKSYFKTISRVSSDPTKDTITEKIEIDANSYANVIVSSTEYTLANGKKITETISKSKQTYYEYELELNESKREIKLLRSEFVTQSRSFYQTGLMDELIRVLNE